MVTRPSCKHDNICCTDFGTLVGVTGFPRGGFSPHCYASVFHHSLVGVGPCKGLPPLTAAASGLHCKPPRCPRAAPSGPAQRPPRPRNPESSCTAGMLTSGERTHVILVCCLAPYCAPVALLGTARGQGNGGTARKR